MVNCQARALVAFCFMGSDDRGPLLLVGAQEV